MHIAAFNCFPFHYEMFGYIIHYCKENNMDLTIFTNFENDLMTLVPGNTFYSVLVSSEGIRSH